ncbi:MAG: outer membrane protein transport protein [Paracoccaceae bacterium]|nr:outer membrane protein transport protein [Paracoccaceae bacterium]
MKRVTTAISALALSAGAASAGGIDRSGQGIGALFEKGNYFEFSLGAINPSLTGTDVAAFGGGSTGSVADDFVVGTLSYKRDLTETLSAALIFDQPFGADILFAPTSVALGGTNATAETYALTGLLRYKLNGGFSVHGGIRAQRARGSIGLKGLAYGPVNGYNVTLATDTAFGYVVGVAYEKPEIALRVALTYNSEIDHDFDTVETLGGNIIGVTATEVTTPQSVNLDFQSGVAKDTLVFGSVRWTDWSKFLIDPATFTNVTGGGLVSLDDSVTYTLGVGRRFTENWSGALSFAYEDPKDRLVSPLAPSTGRKSVSLAAIYTKDAIKVTTGVSYIKLGNAFAETGTPDVARSEFNDSDAVAFGVKVGYSF